MQQGGIKVTAGPEMLCRSTAIYLRVTNLAKKQNGLTNVKHQTKVSPLLLLPQVSPYNASSYCINSPLLAFCVSWVRSALTIWIISLQPLWFGGVFSKHPQEEWDERLLPYKSALIQSLLPSVAPWETEPSQMAALLHSHPEAKHPFSDVWKRCPQAKRQSLQACRPPGESGKVRGCR